MTTPYQDLLHEAGEEQIIAVVLGDMGWGDYNTEKVPNYERMPKGKVITIEEAKAFLDYKYDTGYGSPELPCIYAWTETRVISVCQYDGATGFYSIPRNPQECQPQMVGG